MTLLYIGAIILVIFASLYFWSVQRGLPEINFAEIKKGEVASSVACSGVVKAEGADLSSKMGGKIAWIGVDVGDRVKAGQLLLKFDTYDQAKRDYDSVSNLYSKGLASKQQLEMAKIALSEASLVSPVTGVLAKKSMEIGEVASPGIAILTVVNPGKIWVEAEIDEIDIGETKEGAESRIYADAYPDEVFYGEVSWISRAAELKEGVSVAGEDEEKIFKSKILLSKYDARLKPGMNVDIDVVIEKKEGVVVAPREAVVVKDSKIFVYVLKGRRVRERVIEIGIKDMINVEVKKGLALGERVAVSGLDKLKNRARVKIKK